MIVYRETRGRPRRLKVDPRPGHYYVCAVDGGRVALLAGPFRYHRQARRFYLAAKHEALKVDLWAWFYQWGTCRTEHGRVAGTLNEQLGIRAGYPQAAEDALDARSGALGIDVRARQRLGRR